MKDFKTFYKNIIEQEDSSEHEITVGNYTTKHFYMCGSAQTVMKKNADVNGAEELTRLQDDFYKLEKQVMDAGSATDEHKETAKNLYNKIMKIAGEVGLADDIDDYMLQHINSIEKGDPKPGFGRTDINEKVDLKMKGKKMGDHLDDMLKKHKRGENIGVTALARLKARGLIPRTDGTKKKGKLGKS